MRRRRERAEAAQVPEEVEAMAVVAAEAPASRRLA